MTIVVLGATGFVGRAVVDALAETGEHVRAVARHLPSRRERSVDADVEWVRCDVHDRADVERTFRGAEVVYYLVHSMADASNFRRLERESATNVADAAAAKGVSRIVYLGGVAPRGEASEHLASRLDVGRILRSGSVPTVELRASMIVGNGSASWRILRDLALRLPVMLLPQWLESKTCPIALADVVRALLDARTVPLPNGSAWFDVPGPEALRVREMLSAVARLRGREIPALKVPLLTPRLSAGWLKLISGANYDVARELVLGLREDLLPDDAHYWQLTGHPPRFTFREAAEAALRTERQEHGAFAFVARAEERIVRRLGRRFTASFS